MYKSLAIAYDVVKCSILFKDTFFIFVMEGKKKMETQSMMKNLKNDFGKGQTLYVGLNSGNYSDTINGFLAIDQLTRAINLGLFETLKYRESLNIVPGTSEYVQISPYLNDFGKDQPILRIVLDSNFSVVKYEYVQENGELIEDVLANKVNEKISGIYPGTLQGQQKEIKNMDEANVYLLVRQVIDRLDNLSEFYNEHYIELANQELDRLQSEKIEWEYAFDFCLANLARFGVEQHFSIDTKRMEETDTFKAWYQWWSEYFEEIQNDKNLFKLFCDQRKNCLDLKMFRPNGSFNDLLCKKKVKEKI